MLHPSAHVDPKAELGADVTVGPGAVIDAGCVLGDRCEVRAHAIVTGSTIMGADGQIGYGAVVGAEPQDTGYNGAPTRVRIGTRCIIREHATIHRGTKEGTETVIGDGCFLMTGAHVAHNCRLGNGVTLVNNVLLAGHVEVGDRAFLGGAAVVHQFVRIGAYAIMRGQTRIGKDLPPYFMATHTNAVSGLNRVGLKRAGFGPQVRRDLQTAYDILYKDGLNVTQAVRLIRDRLAGPEIDHLLTFIEATKRGICLHRDRHAEDED